MFRCVNSGSDLLKTPPKSYNLLIVSNVLSQELIKSNLMVKFQGLYLALRAVFGYFLLRVRHSPAAAGLRRNFANKYKVLLNIIKPFNQLNMKTLFFASRHGETELNLIGKQQRH